jgi:hypothetical protein
MCGLCLSAGGVMTPADVVDDDVDDAITVDGYDTPASVLAGEAVQHAGRFVAQRDSLRPRAWEGTVGQALSGDLLQRTPVCRFNGRFTVMDRRSGCQSSSSC